MIDFDKNVCAFQIAYKSGDEWKYDYCRIETHESMCLWNETDDINVANIAAADWKKYEPKDIAYIFVFFGYKGGNKKSDVKLFFESQVMNLYTSMCCGCFNRFTVYLPNPELFDQYEREVWMNV